MRAHTSRRKKIGGLAAHRVFLRGPLLLAHVGAQVVVPALAALLAHAPLELDSDRAPVARAELLHELRELFKRRLVPDLHGLAVVQAFAGLVVKQELLTSYL